MQSAEKKTIPNIAIQASAGWRPRKKLLLLVEELNTDDLFP
jgi:hypothetical protein